MHDVTCKHSCRKINVHIVVLETLPKTSDEKLPDPKGTLSKTVPTLAVTKANEEEVSKSVNSNRMHM